MKIYFLGFVTFCIIIFDSYGQLKIQHFNSKPIGFSLNQEAVDTDKLDTLQYFFWDDFSDTEDGAPKAYRIINADTFALWDVEASKNTLVNASLASKAPTYKTATFDGLNASGDFLQVSEEDQRGEADVLQSMPINLLNGENVYLSFFWQAGGNVEAPDARDSLRLEFKNAENQWRTIWRQGGNSLRQEEFTQEILPITGDYLHKGFQFRFTSIGDLNGPFDAWHLDWIYLNDNRNADDLTYLDRALTGPLQSPFSPFSALPVDQILTNENAFLEPIESMVSNLDSQPQPMNYLYEIFNLGGDLLLSSGDSVFPLSRAESIQDFTLRPFTFSSFPSTDSIVLRTRLSLNTRDISLLDGNIDLRANDTIRSQTILHNYLAYDDGTAEYAAGTNVANGQVGVQYWINRPDTLTAVDIYFPKIQTDTIRTSLTLRIRKVLDNDVTPLRNQNIAFGFSDSLNTFTRYELTPPIILSDTFFITYQQFVNQFISVGFDRNSLAASPYIFDNTGEGWRRNEELQGALMIRPVFAKSDSLVLGKQNRLRPPIELFPNPVHSSFELRGDFDFLQVTDLSGKILLPKSSGKSHDISNLKKGIYLVIIHKDEQRIIKRIIKR